MAVVGHGRKSAPRGTDVALYHVGNNPDAHAWIVDALRRRPGVVVLHDFVLHHLVAGMTVGRRDGHGYLDLMEREHGVVGRLLAHGVLDKRIPPLWESRPADFPLATFVLEDATALIVHSRYVRDQARAAGYEGPISVVPAPGVAGSDRRARARRPGHRCRLLRRRQLEQADPGAPPGDGGGTAGTSRRSRSCSSARPRPGFDLERRLQRIGLADEALLREGWVDESRLWRLMAGSDVLVNLRHPTMGETSGSVIRGLSLGKPLVVSDVGWFSELPDDVALKVPPDDDEVATLTAALELLASRPDVRAAMGASAAELARREHDVARVAELYVAAIEAAVGGPAVDDAVLHEVSEAAADVGISAETAEAREIARRLAEVELG